MLELKSILHDYAKDEFRRRFGFDWNGNSSRPTDLISGGRVRGFEALAAFPTYPVDTNEITQWIDTDLFTYVFLSSYIFSVIDDIVGGLLISSRRTLEVSRRAICSFFHPLTLGMI